MEKIVLSSCDFSELMSKVKPYGGTVELVETALEFEGEMEVLDVESSATSYGEAVDEWCGMVVNKQKAKAAMRKMIELAPLSDKPIDALLDSFEFSLHNEEEEGVILSLRALVTYLYKQ